MKNISTNSAICPHCGYHNDKDNPDNLLKIGTLLNNRFLIGKVFAQSTISITYMARDTKENCKVYIEEFFPTSICRRNKNSVYFEEEYNISYKTMASDIHDRWISISKIKSDCLNHFVDIFPANNTVYAVTKFIQKVTLTDYLNTNPNLSWQKIKTMFLPIFSFVSKLNSLGISHCGICPDNIWVTKNETLVLTGFSLPEARTVGSIIPHELYSGYSAPEQYKKNLWQGEWTDVYSLAAVLFKVLTMQEPIDAQERIIKDTQKVVAFYNDNVPDNVSVVIKNAMSLDKKNRFASIDMFSGALLSENTSNTAVFGVDRTRVATPAINNNNKTNNKNYDIKFILMISFAVLLTISCIANFVFMYNLYSSKPMDMETTSSSESQNTVHKMEHTFVGMHKKSINPNNYKDFVIEYVYDYNDDYPMDIIVRQSVKEGDDIPTNKKIILTVSKGSKFVSVPYLIGSTKDFASRTLTDMGIKYDFVYLEDNESEAPINTVIDMSISYGVKFNKEIERVILTIKKDPFIH